MLKYKYKKYKETIYKNDQKCLNLYAIIFNVEMIL